MESQAIQKKLPSCSFIAPKSHFWKLNLDYLVDYMETPNHHFTILGFHQAHTFTVWRILQLKISNMFETISVVPISLQAVQEAGLVYPSHYQKF